MSDQIVEYKVNAHDTVTLSPSIVRNYLVSGDADAVTNQEIQMFLALCKYRRLNPFLKEAYLIKYGTRPATLVTGRDVFVKRAASNPKYDGIESGLHLQDPDGALIHRPGSFRLPSETIVGAWARVFRKDWSHPVSIDVSFEEYVGRKSNGEVNRQWSEKPATMILKVAEVQALRKAFPEEFSGLYDEAENASIAGDATVADDGSGKEDPQLEAARRQYRQKLQKAADDGVINQGELNSGLQYLNVPKTQEALDHAWEIVERRLCDIQSAATTDEVVVDDAEIVEDESQGTMFEAEETAGEIY